MEEAEGLRRDACVRRVEDPRRWKGERHADGEYGGSLEKREYIENVFSGDPLPIPSHARTTRLYLGMIFFTTFLFIWASSATRFLTP